MSSSNKSSSGGIKMTDNYFVQSSNSSNAILPSITTSTSSNSTSIISCKICGAFPCVCFYNNNKSVLSNFKYNTYGTHNPTTNTKYFTDVVKIGEIHGILIYANKNEVLSILNKNNCSDDYEHEAIFYAYIKDTNHKITYSFDEDKFYQNDENNIEIKIKNKNHIKEILKIHFINEIKRVVND